MWQVLAAGDVRDHNRAVGVRNHGWLTECACGGRIGWARAHGGHKGTGYGRTMIVTEELGEGGVGGAHERARGVCDETISISVSADCERSHWRAK
eukprot:1195742-Prorocentrum_minimum.AAC.1